jgi:hypothetical protein
MIENKKEFFSGFGLIIVFVIVLVLFFSTIFGGQNGMDYLDNLYNSISKGSAYYIPKMREESDVFKGNTVGVVLAMKDPEQAEQTARLFKAGDAETTVSGGKLKVEGDLGRILENCLADADAMYYNDGEKISGKYGYDERQAMYNWWRAFKEMDKDLKRQKKFRESKVISLVEKKAVECSYNYYKIEPIRIGDRIGIVVFSLIFYVIYTVWYGFAFMFMFEGWGMKLGH